MAKYQVHYMAKSGDVNDAVVTVNATTDADGNELYYATNLKFWGCGKNGKSPEQAIRLLVQDMATVLEMVRLHD